MGIPDRFREPVALAEASAFGIAGIVFALLGPWPWLAAVAGPLIALVVLLVITTWRSPGPDLPELEPDIAKLVRQWANKLEDGDPARAHADNAVELADAIDDLTFQCERRIVHLDDRSAQKARDSLSKITDYVTRYVDTYTDTSTAPVKASEWSALVRRLQTAHKELQEELDDPPWRS